ncbi:S1 RNA-binding domain-containing protein [Vagococcus lutrae]|uniref:CvfD/Ygs/GSP13 family RNA-binding post-transcriptional regulator n=1 Tax=Vagococcus lutrae TaxID=81947 RepID=UPI001C97522A|nr:CvfD/Ygs/GSP13 family RNA-binding post-transcriptional regulator [Vagococcus lutrae]MDT2817097.1 CvfD/Ygs/GSP13 family RNA-binding post-transcriptional regulator [Vagococcus lutrae]QZN89387.1 S1 RNA-binding domain-containing protein [Vagococcus lutrae]UQF71295.1 CvfD/Ygs/GSP13 family RNA-binding post-transcriptional regulator [Vagococcus lutrae]WEB81961.1 CvfD/Ygs/GSP13 family RNA-binding post-transcriptional regulator [Vagococcus lutrae]
MTYKIGDIVTGVVTGIQPYGAFVLVDDEFQGLIHISEVKSGYIKDIAEYLEIGQEITVQIIDIDEYTKKCSLSLRSLSQENYTRRYRKKHFFTHPHHEIGFQSLADNMPAWIEEAMTRLSDK